MPTALEAYAKGVDDTFQKIAQDPSVPASVKAVLPELYARARTKIAGDGDAVLNSILNTEAAKPLLPVLRHLNQG